MTAACSQSITTLLGADHRWLDQRLVEAKRRLAAGEVARAAEEFAAFRAGLERHIEVEETVLFPALERHTGAALTAVLREEHVELRRLLEAVAGALRASTPGSHATPWPALTARIYAHNGKEERLLYPLADQRLRAEPQLRAELIGLLSRPTARV